MLGNNFTPVYETPTFWGEDMSAAHPRSIVNYASEGGSQLFGSSEAPPHSWPGFQGPLDVPGPSSSMSTYTHNAPKIILCHLDHGHCPSVLLLSPQNIKRGIAEHIQAYHPPSESCTWTGCACTSHGPRCGPRPVGHAAHVADLAEHVLNTHLGFRYACDLCGRAQWASPFALSRHRRVCQGRATVRCPGCLDEFAGELALEGHAAHRGCYAV